ncbi:tetratricopeptide repeat protein [Rheinheimera marina]|uniref:Tetratricopeptide repeat protein n=1 Tax=Rheinheimera marina TaxID=1774958 RepID=A0ABV9JPW9_9GAMM
MTQQQYPRLWGAVLSFLMLLSVPLAAQEPDWLSQVRQQKAQQPDAMLHLLQQHQTEFASWDRAVQLQYLLQQADIFESLEKYQQQQQVAERALELLADERTELTVEFWNNLGFAREMQGQYQQAMQQYQQASELARQLGLQKLAIEADINIAAIYSADEKYQDALQLLKACYEQAAQLKDEETQAYVNSELGLLYLTLGFDRDARQFMQQALASYKKLGFQKEQLDVLFNLATSYSQAEDYALSMQYYDELLQLAKAQNDKVNLYFAYLGLASTSRSSDKTDAALAYIEKAEQYLPALQSTYQNAMHHLERAMISRDLGQISLASQQLEQAEQALAQGENNQNQSSRLGMLRLKAKLEADLGRYQQAYQHLDEFYTGYRKLRNKEHELSVERLRLAFDVERQAAANELLAKDNELKAMRLQEVERNRQIQWLWITIFGFTTLILLILLLWQLTRRQQQLTAQRSEHGNSK